MSACSVRVDAWNVCAQVGYAAGARELTAYKSVLLVLF